jgi:hypothetical protein
MFNPMRHKTVTVPDIGTVDHAWDILGEWEAELELLAASQRIRGHLAFRSWDKAELALAADEAAQAGVPARVFLSRETTVERSQAGGGAFEWFMSAKEAEWAVQCVLWPGELFSRVAHVDGEEELYRLRARRPASYYAAKYP